MRDAGDRHGATYADAYFALLHRGRRARRRRSIDTSRVAEHVRRFNEAGVRDAGDRDLRPLLRLGGRCFNEAGVRDAGDRR